MSDKNIIHIIDELKGNLKHYNKKYTIFKTKKCEFSNTYIITDELKIFLKLDKNNIKLIEIINLIIQYIKDMNLQDPINNKNIIPNQELKFLFKLKDDDYFNYFNLQKNINKHLIFN